MNEPRNWKWMVPAMLAPVLLIGSVFMLKASGAWIWLRLGAVVTLFWMWICGQAAARNYRAYFTEHEAYILGMRQRALAITPDTELAKTLRNAPGLCQAVDDAHANDLDAAGRPDGRGAGADRLCAVRDPDPGEDRFRDPRAEALEHDRRDAGAAALGWVQAVRPGWAGV
jgi:hypothetical protein